MNQKNFKKSAINVVSFNLSYFKPKYWGSWAGVFLLWFMAFVPAYFVDVLAAKLGDLIRSVNKKRRRIARININLCFPELNENEKKELVRRCFRHQARSVLYLGFLWWAPDFLLKKRIVFKGQEYIEQSFKNNRSVIFMAPHSLALDAAISIVGMNYESAGTYKPIKNKLFDWFMFRGRSRHKGLIYTREAGFRPVMKAVRKGSTMFYLPDEDLGEARSIFASFFGEQKATIPVLGRLAKTCNADVLPCMVCYDEKTRRYVVNILPALKDFPTADDYRDTVAMNNALEEAIRLCPSQYFWTLKLFKTRPAGEKKLYL